MKRTLKPPCIDECTSNSIIKGLWHRIAVIRNLQSNDWTQVRLRRMKLTHRMVIMTVRLSHDGVIYYNRLRSDVYSQELCILWQNWQKKSPNLSSNFSTTVRRQRVTSYFPKNYINTIGAQSITIFPQSRFFSGEIMLSRSLKSLQKFCGGIFPWNLHEGHKLSTYTMATMHR